MGIWFGLATALSWSIGIFPFTEASKAFGANPVNTIRLMLATLALAIITVFISDLSFESLIMMPGMKAWFWLGLSGLLGLALGDYFSFRAFASLGARNSSVFSTLAPGAALLAAFLIKDTVPRWVELLGMLVTLSGVYLLLFLKGKESQGGKFDLRGIADAVLAALCQGAGLVFSELGIESNAGIDPVHAAFMRMFSGSIILYITALFSGRLGSLHQTVWHGNSKAKLMLISGTVFGPILGNSLAMLAVQELSAPVAQTIFSLVPIMAIPLSALFYSERIKPHMIWPALLAFLGVVILVSL